MNNISGSTQFLTLKEMEGSTYIFQTDDGDIIRMNRSVADDEYKVGTEIPAFIYPNVRGELFATPIIPPINRDKFGFALVSDVNRDGAYIDIGAPREFLIPWIDLPKLKSVWPKVGDKVYATLRAESDNQLFGKLVSETEVESFTEKVDEDTFKKIRNTWLVGRPYRLLKVGTFLLTDDGYKVFVHESERTEEPRLGQEVKFRVIGFNDKGELNGSFIEKAYKKRGDDADEIYEYLLLNGGTMTFNDKSSADDIRETFNMSKASFKRALGGLMKKGLVGQDKNGTYIIEKKDKESTEN